MGLKIYIYGSQINDFFIKIDFLEKDTNEKDNNILSNNFFELKEVIEYSHFEKKSFMDIKEILDNDRDNFEFLPMNNIYRIRNKKVLELIIDKGIDYFLNNTNYNNENIEETMPINAKTAAMQTMKNTAISKVIEREKKNIYKGIRTAARKGTSEYIILLDEILELKNNENDKKIFCEVISKELNKMNYKCRYNDKYFTVSWSHLINWGE